MARSPIKILGFTWKGCKKDKPNKYVYMSNKPVQVEITQLLGELQSGDDDALDRLFPLIYEELLSLARRRLYNNGPATYDSVALVNEAYLKLVDAPQIHSRNRAQFFALASKAMRRILIDHARHKQRKKRGGGERPVPLDEATVILAENQPVDLLDLDEALNNLAEINEEASRVVECRFFGGLTLDETAEALDIPVSRVRRRWDYARTWLFTQLKADENT